MKEIIWKEIPGFKGAYLASNDGQIKSVDRYVKSREQSGGKQIKRGRLIKQQMSNSGYLRIQLSGNGETKKHLTHRLIAKTFIPCENDSLDINHKNGIKIDNRPENLEWVSQSENQNHAVTMGLQKRKITTGQISEIRNLYATGKFRKTQIAEMYNISSQYVCTLVNR